MTAPQTDHEARVREAREKFCLLLLRDFLGETTNEPDAALDALIAAVAARERARCREAVESLIADYAPSDEIRWDDALAAIDSLSEDK